MPAASSALVIAPAAGFLLLTYASRPATAGTVGPLRLAVLRAALATGGFAVLSVEVLGALGALTVPAFALAWLLFLGAAGTLAARRHRRAPWLGDARQARSFLRTTSRGERLLAGTVAGLLLVELVIALLAVPNNYDSQTYHLPKVEHWVAQGDLSLWPTAIHRQVTIPPGAEYLLLHLRLFTGGDALYNLVQWAAGIICLLAAARIVGQFGGGRRAQLITAFLVTTTPMVALQATSTQTDLVAAAWTISLATLVLDGLTRRASAGSVLAMGTASGLAAITKTSGLLGVGPLLVFWGIAQLRLALISPGALPGAPGATARTGSRPRAVARLAGASAALLVVAAVITGPFLLRITAEFGNPLGPPRLRESIPMQRHDPASVLVNGLRIGHTALDTPVAPLRDATAAAVNRVADVLGVDPQDRAITFGRTTFPVPSWYPDEDRVSFPLVGALVLIGGGVALIRPGRMSPRHAGALRGYAVVVGAALLLHATTIKWQPWGNRLLLYCLVLAIPLAGLWVDAVLRRRTDPARRSFAASIAASVVVAVLAGSALAGVLAISYGFPRRLVGAGSLLTTPEWETRFLRRPQWADEYRWAADAVQAAGARRIGLVEQNDDWEYPWWLLFRPEPSDAGRPGGRRELVALRSVLPSRPPADPGTVDAIVCTGDRRLCTDLVPPGWRVEFRGYVGFALPPGPN